MLHTTMHVRVPPTSALPQTAASRRPLGLFRGTRTRLPTRTKHLPGHERLVARCWVLPTVWGFPSLSIRHRDDT